MLSLPSYVRSLSDVFVGSVSELLRFQFSEYDRASLRVIGVYKCSYTRLMYVKMTVARGQNAQGTVTGEAGRPADFRRRARRPVPGPLAPRAFYTVM